MPALVGVSIGMPVRPLSLSTCCFELGKFDKSLPATHALNRIDVAQEGF